MKVLLNITSIVVFLSISSVVCSSAAEVSVLAGGLCSPTRECGSDILYCGDLGVCLCNQSSAKLVYQINRWVYDDIQVPLCEVHECSVGDDSACTRSEHCADRSNGTSETGICRCDEHLVAVRGASQPCQRPFWSNFMESCKSRHFCRLDRKLECNRYSKCDCFRGHVFDSEEGLCVRKTEFIERYGASALGRFGGYCKEYDDCSEAMQCVDSKCDCPSSCPNEMVKTQDSCYCERELPAVLFSILTSIVIFFVMWALVYCCCVRKCCVKKQSRARSCNTESECNTSGGAPPAPVSSSRDYFTPAPPSAPPQYSDLPPSYEEATKDSPKLPISEKCLESV